MVSEYANENNWVLRPSVAEKDVDTLFFYPTFYAPLDPKAAFVCDLDCRVMRRYAPEYLESVAPIFSCTNVYAPYYRQCDLGRLSSYSGDALLGVYPRVAVESAYAALDYYFSYCNGGRPFVLAGHSQGSTMLCLVLAEYLRERPELLKRMVVAYVIGFGVTEVYLQDNPHLHFAEGAYDTGVIVSYNTEGPGNSGARSFVVPRGSVAINPLNWHRDGTPARESENMGMAEGLAAKMYPRHLRADACLDVMRGAVICSTADPRWCAFSMVNGMGRESYHAYDYYFYFENLRCNVRDRVRAFLAEREVRAARMKT